MEQLSYPQHEILRLISVYIEEHGKLPYRENLWFVERTTYSGNYITNIKGQLTQLGYLTRQRSLTPKGEAYIQRFFGPFAVQGVEVRVQGTAKAGPSDSTIVQLEEFDSPSEETIIIPSSVQSQDVFAVKVVGESMVALGIMPDDYALVEKQSRHWWPDPQDIILTKYLPHDPARSEDYDPNPADYVGPVIKVYLKRVGERGCRLGWRKSNDKNPFLILADALSPIGKVIGVYRDYRRPSLPFVSMLDEE